MPSPSELSSLLGLNFEALQSSEAQMDIYQSTRRNVSEGKETLSRLNEEPQISQREICVCDINLLNPTGHVMHQQFNIQQLYVLPTLYLCFLYLSENKQRLVPLTA